jgi:hypothetical protein
MYQGYSKDTLGINKRFVLTQNNKNIYLSDLLGKTKIKLSEIKETKEIINFRKTLFYNIINTKLEKQCIDRSVVDFNNLILKYFDKFDSNGDVDSIVEELCNKFPRSR